MNVSRLASWVRRKPGLTHAFQLVFISGDDTEESVQTWTKDELEDVDTDDFASLIIQTAQDDCDTRELVSRYYLRCVDVDGRTLASQTLKQRPASVENDPLNIDGQAGNSALQQMVRCNEVFLRLLVANQSNIAQGYKQLLQAQGAEIAQLRKREQLAAEIIQRAAVDAMGATVDDAHQSVAMAKLVTLAETALPSIVEALAHGAIPKG
jgi:hypothetical protein